MPTNDLNKCYGMPVEHLNSLWNILKPSNVFIDNHEEIKLGDFGLLNFPSKHSGSPVYMPKEENLNNFDYHSVDFFAFGIILIEIFYSNGSLAVQLARHSQYCWSTSQKLFDILKQAAGKNDFYIELNRIIAFLVQFKVSRTSNHEEIKDDDESISESDFDSKEDTESDVTELFKWSTKINVRPNLRLDDLDPFFKNNGFIMNYVGELINHIDRQMSSTTQNNEQKEKAVEYIQVIENVLEETLDPQIRNAIKFHICQCIDTNRDYPGVTREIAEAKDSQKSKGKFHTNHFPYCLLYF